VSARFQVAVDAADPDWLARFWATALGYRLEEPPPPYEQWSDYWRSVGVPEDELGDGYDSIVDPNGDGPRIWFQQVPEAKSGKNRLHLDVTVGGGRGVPVEVRRQRVDAEAARLVEAGATLVRAHSQEGVDHYFVSMLDPEGNEFDVN
jgi:hypothetical protein